MKFCELFPCGETDSETALGVCVGIEDWKEIVDEGVGTIHVSCGLWFVFEERDLDYHSCSCNGNFEATNQYPADAMS